MITNEHSKYDTHFKNQYASITTVVTLAYKQFTVRMPFLKGAIPR